MRLICRQQQGSVLSVTRVTLRPYNRWSAMYKALGAGRPWVLWIDGDAVVPELSHSVERDILSLNLDDNGTLAEECDIVADGFLEKLLDEADFHDG